MTSGKKRAKITASRVKKQGKIWLRSRSGKLVDYITLINKGTAVGRSKPSPSSIEWTISYTSYSDIRKMTSMSSSGGYKPLDH